MIPDEVTPIDDQLLAGLLAEERALAEGRSPPDDPDGSRRGFSECLKWLRQLGDQQDPPMVEPLMFGRFTILGEVGRGGFGIVYRARDSLLGREVAIKVPRPELLPSAGIQERLLREARAAAGLAHPNIVPLYDVGLVGPVCYLASAYCPGPTLAQWLKGRTEPVPPRRAARLAADLAGAVQHAHERGVLHRDLKPSNVLLDRAGSDDPTPLIADFGLAKMIDEEGEASITAGVFGSPPYMAPEQAAGRNRQIGPATDVHALGAILYEALCGRPPFHGESRAETIRMVIETDPVEPRVLRPGLPRDLEIIVLTCLAKESAHRYRSAGMLADDLESFLQGDPIRARPPSPWRLARTRVRRHPALTTAAALLALAATGFLGILVWANAWQRHYIARLEVEKRRADAQAREADLQRVLAERHLDVARIHQAGQAIDAGQIERTQDLLHDIAVGQGGKDRRGFAWHFLWRRACRLVVPMYGHDAAINVLALSPDGRTVFSGDAGGSIRSWDLTTGRPEGNFIGHRGMITAMAISGDGRFLASSARPLTGPPSEVWLREIDSGRVLARLDGFADWIVGPIGFIQGQPTLWVSVHAAGKPAEVQWFDLAPDPERPRRRPSYHSAGQIHVTPAGRIITLVPDGANERDRWTLRDPAVGQVDWAIPRGRDVVIPFASTSDGRSVAASIAGAGVARRAVDTGALEALYPIASSSCHPAFSPDGGTLAIADNQGLVHLCDRASGRILRLLVGNTTRKITGICLEFSPDGSKLAVTEWGIPGGATPITLWEVATGRRLAEYPGLREHVSWLTFAPDGRSLLNASGPTLRRWRVEPDPDPEPEPSELLAGHADEAWALAFSPDGRILASGSDDTTEPRTIKLWDARSGRLLRGWNGGEGTVAALAFAPDGRTLVSGHLVPGNNLKVWDAATGRLMASLPGHNRPVRDLAFLSDGSLLASSSTDRTIRLWDMSTRRCVKVLTGHEGTIPSIAFAPDGLTLASASLDQTVRLWDLPGGEPRATLVGAEMFTAVAFSPDGRTLAGADEDGLITTWDPATGAVRGLIRGEHDIPRALAFTPDGQALAVAGEGRSIRLWDVVTGQELLTLEGHADVVHSLAFSPDGGVLASSDHGGRIRLWRGPPSSPEPAGPDLSSASWLKP